MSKIYQMLKLQQQLNDETNGKGWEKGISKNGKLIDWRRCMLLECAELIDSYPWKHWKGIDGKADYENIKIETVDIWHFVLSEVLRVNANNQKLSLEALSANIEELKSFESFKSLQSHSFKDHYQEIERVEAFMGMLFGSYSPDILCDHFFAFAPIAKIDINELYELYVGKNILNTFRQNHGYKEGTYKKLWQGKEDNKVMQEILEQKSTITPNELYEELEAYYQKA